MTDTDKYLPPGYGRFGTLFRLRRNSNEYAEGFDTPYIRQAFAGKVFLLLTIQYAILAGLHAASFRLHSFVHLLHQVDSFLIILMFISLHLLICALAESNPKGVQARPAFSLFLLAVNSCSIFGINSLLGSHYDEVTWVFSTILILMLMIILLLFTLNRLERLLYCFTSGVILSTIVIVVCVICLRVFYSGFHHHHHNMHHQIYWSCFLAWLAAVCYNYTLDSHMLGWYSPRYNIDQGIDWCFVAAMAIPSIYWTPYSYIKYQIVKSGFRPGGRSFLDDRPSPAEDPERERMLRTDPVTQMHHGMRDIQHSRENPFGS